jgi:hypothetical protein
MSEVSFTRTRQSYGSQIREALEDMKKKGAIYGDGQEATSDGRQLHNVILTAGQLADILNALGYDIRFGKS